jgi:hypothetical protein
LGIQEVNYFKDLVLKDYTMLKRLSQKARTASFLCPLNPPKGGLHSMLYIRILISYTSPLGEAGRGIQ